MNQVCLLFETLVSAGVLYAWEVCVFHLPGFYLEGLKKGLCGQQD